jgi:hypothetical protein
MANLNDVFRVAVRMIGPSSQDIINVWHCKLISLTSGIDADVVADIVSEISTNYQDLEAAIPNTQTGQEISVQNVTTGQVFGAQAFSPAMNGALTGDTVPATSSSYCYFRTGVPRRVGKKFWGIVTEGHQNNGVVTSTITTALATLAANFIGAWTGGTTGNGYNWGTYNSNLAETFAPFIEAVVAAVQHTQRRRRLGIGS